MLKNGLKLKVAKIYVMYKGCMAGVLVTH